LNAIVAARRDLTNCDLYTTLFPCNECAKIVIQSGIKKVYYLEDKYPDTDSIKAAKKMFQAAGISFEQTPNYEIEIQVSLKEEE
jgi:dCMP deaminase